MLDDNRYNIYKNKDGRWRCYDKETKKVFSYPRLLMANLLGRPLEADEDVHHIDENPDNNNIENLLIVNHKEHVKKHSTKYEDKVVTCPICGKEFIWTAKSQRHRKGNNYNGDPFCSFRCMGIHNQQEQMRRKAQAECS